MKKVDTLNIIRETGVIAIMRAQSSDQLIAAADAIKKGGVRAIEVTMTTPGALGVIAEAKERYGSDVIFGAGTVLDPETGRAAILAGADFIRKGAAALGVGSSLVSQKLLDAGDLGELTRRAAAFIEQVKKGRGL
jgi:2-keto-3-deoxy-6-phosphogluconate aldolase